MRKFCWISHLILHITFRPTRAGSGTCPPHSGSHSSAGTLEADVGWKVELPAWGSSAHQVGFELPGFASTRVEGHGAGLEGPSIRGYWAGPTGASDGLRRRLSRQGL